MSHTPGPWSYASSDKGHRYMIQHLSPGKSGPYFGTVEASHRTQEARDVAKANARLIAAAPDLLAALERLANAISPDGDDDSNEHYFVGPLKLARAAITKAESK